MPRSTPMTILSLTLAFLLGPFGCKQDSVSSQPAAAAVGQAAASQKVAPTKNPFLYRIDGQKPSWIYGTIHLPDDRVLALPKALEKALDSCDRMFAEIPMDPATQVKMTPMLMLKGGKKLDQILPKDLYARLDKLFSAKGLPLSALSGMKVWVITTQAVMLDHIVEFASKKPLDMVLYMRAEQAGKEVGGLETVEEQVAIFDGLTEKEQIRMLEQTLDLIDEFKKKGKDPVGMLLDAYLAGDEEKMLAAMLETYDPENPLDKKMMQRLFFDRNVKMSKRIADKLKAAPDKAHFFAVGAGHLLGEDGMLAMLKKHGLKITRVTGP